MRKYLLHYHSILCETMLKANIRLQQHNLKNCKDAQILIKIFLHFLCATYKKISSPTISLKEKSMNLEIDKASDKLHLKIKKTNEQT